MSPLETGLNQVNWHLGERNTEPGHSTRFLNTQEEKTDKTDSQLLFREEGQSGLHLPVPGALASCIPSRCTLWGGAGRGGLSVWEERGQEQRRRWRQTGKGQSGSHCQHQDTADRTAPREEAKPRP